jgi:hypothetical protein
MNYDTIGKKKTNSFYIDNISTSCFIKFEKFAFAFCASLFWTNNYKQK